MESSRIELSKTKIFLYTIENILIISMIEGSRSCSLLVVKNEPGSYQLFYIEKPVQLRTG